MVEFTVCLSFSQSLQAFYTVLLKTAVSLHLFSTSLYLVGLKIAQVIAMAPQTMAEELERMTEELETLNKKSFKGTCTIESATSVSDINTNNGREHLFNVTKELYGFSKKILHCQVASS